MSSMTREEEASARSRMIQDNLAEALTKFFDTIPPDPNNFIAFSVIQEGVKPLRDISLLTNESKVARNLLYLLVKRFSKLYRQGKPYYFRRLNQEEIMYEREQQKLQNKQVKLAAAVPTTTNLADFVRNVQAAEIDLLCAAVANFFHDIIDPSGRFTKLPVIRDGIAKYYTNSNNYSNEELDQLLLVALRKDPYTYQELPNYYQFNLRTERGKAALDLKTNKAADEPSTSNSPVTKTDNEAMTKPLVAEANNNGKKLLQMLKSNSIGGCIQPSSSLLPIATITSTPSSSSSTRKAIVESLPINAVTVVDNEVFSSEPRPDMPITVLIVQGENMSDVESVDTDILYLADMINDELVAVDRSRGYHSEEEYWQWLMTKGSKHKSPPVLPKVIKHVKPVTNASTAPPRPPPPVDHWHMKNVTTAQMKNTSKLFQCRLLLHIS